MLPTRLPLQHYIINNMCGRPLSQLLLLMLFLLLLLLLPLLLLLQLQPLCVTISSNEIKQRPNYVANAGDRRHSLAVDTFQILCTHTRDSFSGRHKLILPAVILPHRHYMTPGQQASNQSCICLERLQSTLTDYHFDVYFVYGRFFVTSSPTSWPIRYWMIRQNIVLLPNRNEGLLCSWCVCSLCWRMFLFAFLVKAGAIMLICNRKLNAHSKLMRTTVISQYVLFVTVILKDQWNAF